jgi:hypothetical protein
LECFLIAAVTLGPVLCFLWLNKKRFLSKHTPASSEFVKFASVTVMVRFATRIAEIAYFESTLPVSDTLHTEYVSNSENIYSHNSQALRYYTDFLDTSEITLEIHVLGYSEIIGHFFVQNSMGDLIGSIDNWETFFVITTKRESNKITFTTPVPKFLDRLSLKFQCNSIETIFNLYFFRANLVDEATPRRAYRKSFMKMVPQTIFPTEEKDSCFLSSFDDNQESFGSYAYSKSLMMMPSL